MSKKGLGNYQTKEKSANRNKILGVLKDGKSHQFSEILNVTKMSRRILAQHLRELRNKQLVEKEEDKDDFRLKHYRASATLRSMFSQAELINAGLIDIANLFLKTRDLSLAIKGINALTNANMIIALSNIQSKNLDVTNPENIENFLELFVWSTYENLTLNLVNLCITSNLINDIDFEEVAKKLAEN
jgi:DNA-binding MarR family transcriptional regulator